MRWVYVLAGVVVARTAGVWFLTGAQLVPDLAHYTSGRVGLWPSPLGRAVGVGGAMPLALLNAVAAGACIVVVGLLAVRFGGRPHRAALVAATTPFGLWPLFAGVDALGALALLGGVLAYGKGRWAWAGCLIVVAVLMHLATLPVVVGVLAVAALRPRHEPGVARRWVLGALGALSVAGVWFVLVTPYGPAVGSLRYPVGGVLIAAVALWLLLLPFLPLVGSWPALARSPLAVPLVGGLLGTAACVLLMRAAEGLDAPALMMTRYGLPFTLLAAVEAGR